MAAVCIYVCNPVNGASQEQRLQSQPPLKVVGWVRCLMGGTTGSPKAKCDIVNQYLNEFWQVWK